MNLDVCLLYSIPLKPSSHSICICCKKVCAHLASLTGNISKFTQEIVKLIRSLAKQKVKNVSPRPLDKTNYRR